MKTFIAFRSTGEDPRLLEPLLAAIVEAFERRRIEAYCTFFDRDIKDKSLNARPIMEHAFEIINNADFLFVVQASDDKSEGMLIEVGYCLAKKIPIIVATKDSVNNTYLPAMASQSFKWTALEDLVKSIADLQP